MSSVVVTGVSSGLGEALAEIALQEKGTTVVGVSRRGNAELEGRAGELGSTYVDYRFDLSETPRIGELASSIFRHLKDEPEVLLVNNAAVEGPLGRLEAVDAAGLIDHININLTAAMLLSARFVRFTEGWAARRTVVNITSGAAQHPYDGLCAYCASKAGLDMFAKCLALEQQGAPNPVRVISIAPGVLETPMQERLRDVPVQVFPSKERFASLKRDGKLSSPADAARKILSIARGDSFESGSVIDLRSLG